MFVSCCLEPLRGLRFAFEAWPKIATALPGAQFILVGQSKQGYGVEMPVDDHIEHISSAIAALPPETGRTRIHVLAWMEPLRCSNSCSAAAVI